MKHNFDKIIDRKNTGSLKYDAWEKAGMPADVLPLWVADMDFETAYEIRKRMQDLCDFGVFGYTDITDEYFDAVKGWFSRRFGWNVKRQWLVTTPGVVNALSVAVRVFTKPGDGVLIQQPVYYPFSNVIKNNDRVIINNTLKYEDGKYSMDLDDLEEKLSADNTKMMILCSPHNPVGRVWERSTLESVGNLCVKHNVILVCDEIHCDFVYDGHTHTSIGNINDEISANVVVCTAPSKTFNLAGLQVSNIFIPNQKLRRRFKSQIVKDGMGRVNMMGMIACQAAYEEGEEWFEELKTYIRDNIKFLNEFVRENMPRIRIIETQGTYLVWLDLSDLNLIDQKDFIVNKAMLWLDSGAIFGDEGKSFERINVACPRATLVEALERLKKAYDGLE